MDTNSHATDVLDSQGRDAAQELLNPTYRLTEIVGTSSGSIDAAIASGIARAAQTLHGLDWYQVVEIRGSIVAGTPSQTQVTMKVGFRVDD